MAKEQPLFIPDESLEPERLELVEATLGPLIDRHLDWTPIDDSPTAAITADEYGILPGMGVTLRNMDNSLRPRREPLNFRAVSGALLGIDPESLDLEHLIREIDGFNDLGGGTTNGWYRYLIDVQGIDREVIVAMRDPSIVSFLLNANTEHNVPEYKALTMGRVIAIERQLGIKLPAHHAWYNDIWIPEERGHDDGQDDYGKIMRLTTSPQHYAANNSILRSDAEVDATQTFGTAIYTTIQEYSTKIPHFRTAHTMGPMAYHLQKEEAEDETRHFDVYAQIVAAGYADERFSDEIVLLTDQVIRSFVMPGSGIPNFDEKAKIISDAGIFGYEHFAEAVSKSLRKFGMFRKVMNENSPLYGTYINAPGLSAEAEEILEKLRKRYDRKIRTKSRSGLFVLGQTLTLDELHSFHQEYAADRGLILPKSRGTAKLRAAQQN